METVYGHINFIMYLSTAIASILGTFLFDKIGITVLLSLEVCLFTIAFIFVLTLPAIAKQKHHKKMLIGGGVSGASLEFFAKLPTDTLISFETRNIIFDLQASLKDPQIEQALTKAMGFELKWMQRKKEFYGKTANAETARIEMITERYNKQKNS